MSADSRSSLPPLVVLLGSGATMPDIPGVGEITHTVLGSPDPSGAEPLPTTPPADPDKLTGWVAEHARRRAASCGLPRDSINFEDIASMLEAIGDLPRREPQNVHGPPAPLRPLEPWLDQGLGDLSKMFAIMARSRMTNAVLDLVAERNLQVTGKHHLVCGLEALASRFRLWVFSLNYDVVPLMSRIAFYSGYDAPRGRDGDTRGFDPLRVRALIDPDLHYQLHGSVLLGNADYHNVMFPLHDSIERATRVRRATSPGNSSTAPRPAIVGGVKSGAILMEPFVSYFDAFRRALLLSPRWLIVGYGFGDDHVNAALRHSWWRRPESPRRSVVVGRRDRKRHFTNDVQRHVGAWALDLALDPCAVVPDDAWFGDCPVSDGSAVRVMLHEEGAAAALGPEFDRLLEGLG